VRKKGEEEGRRGERRRRKEEEEGRKNGKEEEGRRRKKEGRKEEEGGRGGLESGDAPDGSSITLQQGRKFTQNLSGTDRHSLLFQFSGDSVKVWNPQ
jgi:hypothetical protein